MEAPVRLSSEPLSKERHMEAKDYLAYIVNEIHTTIVACKRGKTRWMK